MIRVLLISFLLFSCQTTRYDYNKYIGQPIESVYVDFGSPTMIEEKGMGKIYVFNTSSSGIGMAQTTDYGTFYTNPNRGCRIVIWVSLGRIDYLEAKGNGC